MTTDYDADQATSLPPNPSRFHHDVAHTPEEIAHRIHWEQALDAGLIETRNPPPPAEVVAINQANDRLFRERARRRGGEG